jgi:IS30 family transposase
MGMPNKLTRLDRKAIADLSRRGWAALDLAAYYEVHPETIRRVLKEIAHERAEERRKAERLAERRELLDSVA